MEPAPRQTLDPAGAGAVLVGTTAGSIGVGALVGAVVGIPAGIFAVYRRYRGVFS